MADKYGGQAGGYVGWDPTGSGDTGYSKDDYYSDVSQGAQEGITKGASVGTSIMPGIGTAIGAIAGGLHGVFSGISSGSAKQRRANAKYRAWLKSQELLAKERYNSRVYATRNITNSYSPANNMLTDMYGRRYAVDMSKTPWGGGGGKKRAPEQGGDYSPAKNAPAARTGSRPGPDVPTRNPERDTTKPKAGQKPKVK